MSGTDEGSRELLISTGNAESDGVLVAVRDSGPGLTPASLSASSRPSTRPSPAVWGWAYRSAVRSSKLIGDGCGRPRTYLMAPSFNSWRLLTQTAYRDLGPPPQSVIIMA